jgi:hypothetical protein
MAVFVAAADESDGPLQKGPFVYGGFIAPFVVWENVFAPMWEEQVLNSDPPIGPFHMTEIRNPKWQALNGLSDAQAQLKIDAAVHVVASIPELRVAHTRFDGGHFRQTFGASRMMSRGRQPGAHRLEPDYVGFMGFARAALEYVHDNHPDAERVDFVVERKTTVTHYLPQYLEELVTWAKKENRHALLDLIGEVIPGAKDRAPLQASDLAMWHIRRHEARESEAVDVLRLAAMFNGRQMILGEITNDELTVIHAQAMDLIRARATDAKREATSGGT